MQKVMLFEFHSPELNVTIEAYFNDKDCLVIDGFDIGKTVTKLLGDSDYEYSMTIAVDEVNKLYGILNLNHEPGELLRWLQANFNSNKCFSEIKKFLTENQILFSYFSWT